MSRVGRGRRVPSLGNEDVVLLLKTGEYETVIDVDWRFGGVAAGLWLCQHDRRERQSAVERAGELGEPVAGRPALV